MQPSSRRPSKAITNSASAGDRARHVTSKRLGRSVQEDENLVLDSITNLLKMSRQKNSQKRDRAEFAVERNVAAHRRLPGGRTNSI